MELSPQQQIFDQIRKANKVLIALPNNPSADSVASGLALKIFLQKLQKDAQIACSGVLPESLMFLPEAGTVISSLRSGKSFVINVNTSVKKLDELSYQASGEKVEIFLKSQGEDFSPEDMTFSSARFPLDIIVTLDVQSLEDLGPLFEQNADLFFETPKINIAHKASNEYFGAINLVDITATSVAEMLTELLEQFESQLLDENIATCLLAGIITKTHSFQHAHTTPQSFARASRLVNLGGRQQEIIKYVYKTKSLSLLKLWGRALARLKTGPDAPVAYSMLSRTDFQKSDASDREVLLVLKELVESLADYKILAVLSEDGSEGVRFVLAVHTAVNLPEFFAALQIPVPKPLQSMSQFSIFDFTIQAMSLSGAETRLSSASQALKSFLP